MPEQVGYEHRLIPSRPVHHDTVGYSVCGERPMPQPRVQPTPDPNIPLSRLPASPLQVTRTPSHSPLQRPIAIPATDAKLGSPFLRAFAPVLEEKYHLPREVFLRFLDDLNRAAVASPPVQVVGLAGNIVSMVPLHTAQIVGGSIDAAATLMTVGMSKGRTEMCLRRANRELFAPRGLKAELDGLDALARSAKMPILTDDGKVDKKASLLGPVEGVIDHESLTAQQRRLRALEPWIAPLDLTPLPELHVPGNIVSKMHAAASESQRKKGERKMMKDRKKAHKDWTKDSREAREEYEDEMAKLGRKEEKAREKYEGRPQEMEKQSRKIEKERDKCLREYERDMRKIEQDRRKDDKEEEGMRKILWLLIRRLDDQYRGAGSEDGGL